VRSNETNWNKWRLLEKRSVSNLIEVMADERRRRLTSIGGGVDAGEALAQGEDLVTA